MGIKTPEWPVPRPTRWSCGQVRPPVPTPGGDSAIPMPGRLRHSHASPGASVPTPSSRRSHAAGPAPGSGAGRDLHSHARRPRFRRLPAPGFSKKVPIYTGDLIRYLVLAGCKKYHFFVKTVNSDYTDYGRPIPVVLEQTSWIDAWLLLKWIRTLLDTDCLTA